MSRELTSTDWRRLTHSIRAGECVLFLGPDASCLDGRTLVASLVAELDGDRDGDLHWAAQTFAEKGYDQFDLIDKAQNFYQALDHRTSDFHRDLAALPFHLCVQTSPDRFMANAFADRRDKVPTEAYFHLRGGVRLIGGGSLGALPEPSAACPLVFGLHGSAENGDSLVLTENDVLAFIVRLVRDKVILPPNLLRLIKQAKTLLFIGFGFHSWYQRLILYVLRGVDSHKHWNSLALEGSRFFSLPDHQQTATYYDKEHRISFSHLSFTEFARELRQRYEVQAAERAPDAPSLTPLPPGAPNVFLSYSREDEPAVTALAAQLRTRGIDTWQDLDQLRGGEDWRKRVVHVVEQVVDYVVLLHSQHLEPGESWVRYEVNLAIERSRKLPPNSVFLIPCHFLGCRQREDDLEHLHYVTVDSPDDCATLAEVILEHWRKKMAMRREEQVIND